MDRLIETLARTFAKRSAGGDRHRSSRDDRDDISEFVVDIMSGKDKRRDRDRDRDRDHDNDKDHDHDRSPKKSKKSRRSSHGEDHHRRPSRRREHHSDDAVDEEYKDMHYYDWKERRTDNTRGPSPRHRSSSPPRGDRDRDRDRHRHRPSKHRSRRPDLAALQTELEAMADTLAHLNARSPEHEDCEFYRRFVDDGGKLQEGIGKVLGELKEYEERRKRRRRRRERGET